MPQTSMPDIAQHFPREIFFDNIGGGYRMRCNCGFETSPSTYLEEIGGELDDHLKDAAQYAPGSTLSRLTR
jgi:hypothetical protein